MALQVWLPFTNTNTSKNQGVLGDLTVTTSPSIVAGGKLGNALKGGAYKMSAAQTAQCLNNKEVSIAFWIKPTTSSSNHIIFGEDGFRQFTVFAYPGKNDLHISWANSTGVYALEKVYSNALPFDKWTHCCITYNNPVVTIYINGSVLATESYNCDITDFAKETRVIHNDTGRYINDFRIYDHCLSAKEVKEIAKGLVLHYPMGDGYIEPTTNIAPYPTPSSAVGAVGWDQSKHPNAIHVNGWSYGYNGGVENPSQGYHACWNIIDGIPTMVHKNMNSEVGLSKRWMGISSNSVTIASGAKYTISFDAKSTSGSGQIGTGIYYNNGSSTNFHDGCPYLEIGKEWKRYSHTYTAKANISGSIYIYGNDGAEGINYVRNIQVEVKDHATPYVSNSKSDIIYDCSGFGNNGIVNSSVITIADTCRYRNSAQFSGAGCISLQNIPSFNSISASFWMKPSASGQTACLLNYRTDVGGDLAIFLIGGQVRFDAGGLFEFTNYSVTTDWQHVCVTYDEQTKKKCLYINGTLKQETTMGSAINCSATSGTIGMSSANSTTGNGNSYTGLLSDYRIYATALSESDVKDLYSTSAVVCDNGTVMAYSLEE